MIDSANPPSPRADRKSETTRSLIRVARRLTADLGLTGFTLEQLCTEATVSRRTFFNYFASKEDAVLGLPLERADGQAIEAFLARGIPSDGVSNTLLSDLAELSEARWKAMDIAPDSIAELISAVEREPRLLARVLEHAANEEQFDARLIEQRENLEPGDVRARVAASLLAAITRVSAGEFLRPGNSDSFADIFERHNRAARELFAAQPPLIGQP